MVPGWLVVPVLILGVLVGAALGWWMRQRTLSAARPQWGGEEPPSPPTAVAPQEPPLAPAADAALREPASTPPAVVAPEQPAPPSPAVVAPEQPAPPSPPMVAAEMPTSPASTQIPPVATPPVEPPPPAIQQLEFEPQPEAAPPATGRQDQGSEAEAVPAPDLEREPETPSEPSSPQKEQAAGKDSATRGEGLDARMEDVLSELERRYRGRRVGPGDSREEGDPSSRPRRPRPRR